MLDRLRTVLLCTPLNPRHIEKALQSNADLVVFDLEDSVEANRKNDARAAVAQTLSTASGPVCYVRLNALTSAHLEDDLAALAPLPGVAGFLLPKVETHSDLTELDRRLTELEALNGRAPGSLRVMPLIETALGVENLTDVLRASPRVDRLSFGAGDYTLDIGAVLSPDELALQYIRARVVNASRAHGKLQPVDSVWLDTSDDQGLRVSSERGLTMGFSGKLCIHPRQVDIVNAVYTPSREEIELAIRQITAFDKALAHGIAAIHVDGMLVDYPIAERARRLLAAAGITPA